MTYDVIIVGSGPSGIFSAIALLEGGVGKILLLEQGKDLKDRARDGGSLLHGWGGAGAFSDGKLTLSTEVGGHLLDYRPEPELRALLREVDDAYRAHGAPDEIHGDDPDAVRGLGERAERAGLRLVPMVVRHIPMCGNESWRSVDRPSGRHLS